MAREPTPSSVPEPFADAEGFLAAFAGSSGAVVSYIDTTEHVRFVTLEAAAWLGKAPHEVVGLTLRQIHEPASYDFFSPYMRRAFAGERVQYERSTRHADGRVLWISV